MQVAVVGLGKIGLPLAAHYASSPEVSCVYGVDICRDVVDMVNAGLEPFPGEEKLAETLREVSSAEKLVATVDYGQAIGLADVVIVAVPLLVDAALQPDFSILDQATQSIAENLNSARKTVVIYETTLPVATTRGRWVPQLEKQSQLIHGQDFHVVYSPERVFTGRVFADLARYPKLLGGITPEGEAKAKDFYEKTIDFCERDDLDQPNGVWDLGSPEAAELAKLAETTYRDVNIALANQFAAYAEKIEVDFHKVQRACNSQPYSHIHSPGVAVGGHCIPVYPHLYLHGDPQATIVSESRSVNKNNVERCVARVESDFGDLAGKKVAVLGLAYRGNVKEDAYSGAHDLLKSLTIRGASVSVHDPLYSEKEIKNKGYQYFTLGSPCDVAIVQANHACYSDLGVDSLPGCSYIFDGRNMTWSSTELADKITVIGVG